MTDTTETYFEIKDETDFIRIAVLKQNFPDAELDWDKNSVNCLISVRCGGFSGKFSADLMSTDFEIFKKEMEIVYKSPNRNATFEGLESQVNIRVEGDGIGHFSAHCRLLDYAGTGNELKCELDFDQTLLPELIGQLNEITSEFKVFGKITEVNSGANNT